MFFKFIKVSECSKNKLESVGDKMKTWQVHR